MAPGHLDHAYDNFPRLTFRCKIHIICWRLIFSTAVPLLCCILVSCLASGACMAGKTPYHKGIIVAMTCAYAYGIYKYRMTVIWHIHIQLTHCGPVTAYCDAYLDQHLHGLVKQHQPVTRTSNVFSSMCPLAFNWRYFQKRCPPI